MRRLLAGLCLGLLLSGCSPGATNVAIDRPSHPVEVTCRGSSGERHDARLILGLSEAEANAIVGHWGCILRVFEANGRKKAQIAEGLSYRIGVAIMDNRIVRITGIG
jgi:hypothetical protein